MPAVALEASIQTQLTSSLSSGAPLVLKVKVNATGAKRNAEGTVINSSSSSAGAVFSTLSDILIRLCDGSIANQKVLKELAGFEIRHARLTADDIAGSSDGEEDHTQLVQGKDGTRAHITLCQFLSPDSSFPWRVAHLSTLDLECNAIGDEGVKRLCRHVLPNMPQLSRLLLASNQISADGLDALVSGLCGGEEPSLCPSLAVLGLTNNPLGREGEGTHLGTQLGSVLRSRERTIHRLHINHVGITADSLVAMLLAAFTVEHSGPELPRRYPSLDLIYAKQNNMTMDDVKRGLVEEALVVSLEKILLL